MSFNGAASGKIHGYKAGVLYFGTHCDHKIACIKALNCGTRFIHYYTWSKARGLIEADKK